MNESKTIYSIKCSILRGNCIKMTISLTLSYTLQYIYKKSLRILPGSVNISIILCHLVAFLLIFFTQNVILFFQNSVVDY